MLDSKPDASSAHIVVNIASLPSTLTALGGAGCKRGFVAGGAWDAGGACVWACAGAGAGVCAAVGNAMATHNPSKDISRRSFFMPFAAAFPWVSRSFDLRPWRFSARAYQGAVHVLSRCCGTISNLPSRFAPVKETHTHFLPVGSRNACLLTLHLVTVEMRPNAARMALSDDSPSPKKSSDSLWNTAGRNCHSSYSSRSARSRQCNAALAGRRAEFCFGSNAAGQKAPLPGSPTHGG